MFTIRQETPPEPLAFALKAGDDHPPFASYLGGLDGTLAGATIRFEFWPAAGGPRRGGPGVVADATAGLVAYAWRPGDTATPGAYLGEWKVTGSDGRITTYPARGHERFEITE